MSIEETVLQRQLAYYVDLAVASSKDPVNFHPNSVSEARSRVIVTIEALIKIAVEESKTATVVEKSDLPSGVFEESWNGGKRRIHSRYDGGVFAIVPDLLTRLTDHSRLRHSFGIVSNDGANLCVSCTPEQLRRLKDAIEYTLRDIPKP